MVTHHCCVTACLQTAKLQEEQSMKDSDLTFNPTFFTNAPVRGDEPVGVYTDGVCGRHRDIDVAEIL
jgi:hypothetical protein